MRSRQVVLGVVGRLRDLEGELRRRRHPDRARVVADLAGRYEATLQRLKSVEDLQAAEDEQQVPTSARPLGKRGRSQERTLEA